MYRLISSAMVLNEVHSFSLVSFIGFSLCIVRVLTHCYGRDVNSKLCIELIEVYIWCVLFCSCVSVVSLEP